MRSAGLARMTVVSYNIHRAVGTDRRYRPDRIATVLEELRADIVALQEVESGSSNDHTLEYLAGHTGMHVVSGFTRVRGNADYGNALLTRFAPQAVSQIDLTVKGCEARGAIDVTLACMAAGHASALRVIATHLGLRPGERRHQVQQLLNYVAAAPPLPTILVGDVNEWFLWGRPLRWLHAYFEQTPHTATFPSRLPIFALDRIWGLAARAPGLGGQPPLAAGAGRLRPPAAAGLLRGAVGGSAFGCRWPRDPDRSLGKH